MSPYCSVGDVHQSNAEVSAMENILIIKTNASGDVLRTTVLLHFLQGHVFWLTASYNIPLFPDAYPNLTIVSLEKDRDKLLSLTFDYVINLEEDRDLAVWASRLQSRKLIGAFYKEGKILYTADSAKWFNMSLISKFSRQEANEQKLNNQLSYQQMICQMIGHEFSGEPYILHQANEHVNHANKIGIESRVGKRWPNKQWYGYDDLTKWLSDRGSETIRFEQRQNLRQYMADIHDCRLVITGDTLAMHIAIGYSIPCIAIFNCTSPQEIHDYGILQKLVSPLLSEVYYKTALIPEAIRAISFDAVVDAVEILIST